MPLEGGFVERDTVFAVLQFFRVSVSPKLNGPADTFILTRDDKFEVIIIPSEVGRQMLQFFKRKFGIQIHLFYHPDVLPLEPHNKPN